MVVKDWDTTVSLTETTSKTAKKKVMSGGGGLAWGGGGDGMGLVSCCDSKRMVQFWGVGAKDP